MVVVLEMLLEVVLFIKKVQSLYKKGLVANASFFLGVAYLIPKPAAP